DPRSLAVRWQSTTYVEPHLSDGIVVSYDGNGHVEARTASTGELRWEHDHPGALDIRIVDGRVYLRRTYGDAPTPPTRVLELATGRRVAVDERTIDALPTRIRIDDLPSGPDPFVEPDRTALGQAGEDTGPDLTRHEEWLVTASVLFDVLHDYPDG